MYSAPYCLCPPPGCSPSAEVPGDQRDGPGPRSSQRGPLPPPAGRRLRPVEEVRKRGAAVQTGPGDQRERLRWRARQRGPRAGVAHRVVPETEQVRSSMLKRDFQNNFFSPGKYFLYVWPDVNILRTSALRSDWASFSGQINVSF